MKKRKHAAIIGLPRQTACINWSTFTLQLQLSMAQGIHEQIDPEQTLQT
jgi:hypothetical protein